MLSENNLFPKRGSTTYILCLFLGAIGAHRFYTGNIGTGILLLGLSIVSGGLIGLGWALYDLYNISKNKFRDGNNRLVQFTDDKGNWPSSAWYATAAFFGIAAIAISSGMTSAIGIIFTSLAIMFAGICAVYKAGVAEENEKMAQKKPSTTDATSSHTTVHNSMGSKPTPTVANVNTPYSPPVPTAPSLDIPASENTNTNTDKGTLPVKPQK